MIVHSFEIDDALELTPIDPETATQALQSPDARIWLDLQAAQPSELEEWLDRLAVGGLSRRLCLEARDRPGFYPLKREILMMVPVLADTEDSNDVDHLAFLCRENLLLTVHRVPFQHFAGVEDSESWLSERSIAGLVSAVMVDLSLVFLRHTADLRSSILDLEQRMDRDPETVEPEEILDKRAEVMALGAVVGDQLPALQALSVTDKPFFQLKVAQEYVTCALANLRAADGALNWLDQRIGALRSALQMYAQEKTNRRLGVLTILSAIFMPMTLLAGIWGMNFVTMPELKYQFGYPIALGVIALIGSGMFFYFRRAGWFD